MLKFDFINLQSNIICLYTLFSTRSWRSVFALAPSGVRVALVLGKAGLAPRIPSRSQIQFASNEVTPLALYFQIEIKLSAPNQP